MKDLKAFLEDLSTNESLAKKFEGIKKSADIVALAKEEGYEFTKKEYDNAMLEMVAGGAWYDGILQAGKEIGGAMLNAAIDTGKQQVQNKVAEYIPCEEPQVTWSDVDARGFSYTSDGQWAYNTSTGQYWATDGAGNWVLWQQ